MEFTHSKGLKGIIEIPGDKSISHRGVMFGSLSKGTTHITNFLTGADCLSTISCFRKMGVDIIQNGSDVIVKGKGLHGLTAPSEVLYTGNSGTTTRIISGILAGQHFDCELDGDSSIRKRPMKRVMEPLLLMGADIKSVYDNGCAPLRITGTQLHGIDYTTKVASAQVKSAILLAGLFADSKTSVTEPSLSRNHTELMLKGFGADIETIGTTATVKPAEELFAQEVMVPGDISSAAFFIAAALITPNSEVLIKNVGINPTRDGILKVLKNMNADITLIDEHTAAGEPVADILVKTSNLKGTVIEGDVIPALIDELPVIAVIAAMAEGTTVIKDAAELKVKESDRIVAMSQLSKMGVDITPTDDGMIINGGNPLHGATIESYLDHRIAMSFAIASLIADGTTVINNADCVNISYPTFYEDLAKLSK